MKKVISLYYKHENDALRSSSETYSAALSALGYETIIINLAAPDALPTLDQLLSNGEIDFCYAMQGVGSTLETSNHVNLWTDRRIPFICIHYDNLCHNPFNHFSSSRYVANLYCFESFLDIKQRYLPSDQISVAMPFQLPTTWTPVFYDADQFNARPLFLLYVKSGGSLEKREQYINSLPSLVRDGIWQKLEQMQASPNLPLYDLVDEIFITAGFDRRKQEKQFWGVAQTMDDYIRRKRAIDLVNWLKFQEGAMIIGDGWDFIDKTNARATFQPAVSVNEIYQYYLKAKFICNTTPYGRDIMHERILVGLMSANMVISDTNEWVDENLGHLPSLVRFDWSRPLDDQLQPALHDPNAALHAVTGAFEIFIKNASVRPLIDLAQQVRQFADAKSTAA
jgi:hypothetical protein